MDEHPGIVFRDGPAGRRAALASGPDVWEIVRAMRDVRKAEPQAPSSDVLETVCELASLPLPAVQVAVSYYREFPDEINAWVTRADTAAEEAERQLSAGR